MRGCKAPALKQRGTAWPQGLKPATKLLLQGAALQRLIKRAKRQEEAAQQTAKGSNWPELQGNPQGALSAQVGGEGATPLRLMEVSHALLRSQNFWSHNRMCVIIPSNPVCRSR